MSNQLATVSAGIGFVVVFLYANLFEYAFHRWLMHRLHRYVLGASRFLLDKLCATC
jgi:hypothetical protein